MLKVDYTHNPVHNFYEPVISFNGKIIPLPDPATGKYGNNNLSSTHKLNKMIKKLNSNVSPVTQKAQGLISLESVKNTFDCTINSTYFANAKEVMELKGQEIEDLWIYVKSVLGSNIFLRPCPKTPRPGFVDSRKVFSGQDIINVATETYAEDVEGELLFMDFIESNSNIIVGSESVVVGLGHDGATAGKNAFTLSIPSELSNPVLKSAKISDDKGFHIEIVTSNKKSYLTQLRASPKSGGGSADFVPETVFVTNVKTVETEDLLAWEKMVREFAKEKGTVVYHKGGSSASHFGLHCIANKVPYVTTFEPKVDCVLEQTVKPWNRECYKTIASYIESVDLKTLTQSDPEKFIDTQEEMSSYARFALGMLHGLPGLMSSHGDNDLRYVAMSLGVFVKIFTALCLGEARHVGQKDKWYSATEKHLDIRHSLTEEGSWTSDRTQVYLKAYKMPLQNCNRALTIAEGIFKYASWSSSYGGKAWANISSLSQAFVNDLIRFRLNPNEDTFKPLVENLNQIVHLSHNTGWFLNKLLNQNLMTTASTTTGALFAHIHFYRFAEIVKRLKADVKVLTGSHVLVKDIILHRLATKWAIVVDSNTNILGLFLPPENFNGQNIVHTLSGQVIIQENLGHAQFDKHPFWTHHNREYGIAFEFKTAEDTDHCDPFFQVIELVGAIKNRSTKGELAWGLQASKNEADKNVTPSKRYLPLEIIIQQINGEYYFAYTFISPVSLGRKYHKYVSKKIGSYKYQYTFISKKSLLTNMGKLGNI